MNIQLAEKEFVWRIYIIPKSPLTTRRVKLIHNKDFPKTVLDEDVEIFIVHVNFLSLRLMIIHLSWEAHIALLFTEKVTMSTEYTDFADVFSKNSAEMLSERKGINKYIIDLVNSK